jgi:acetyl-CoA carboxylase biotin carboxyl carrier protein
MVNATTTRYNGNTAVEERRAGETRELLREATRSISELLAQHGPRPETLTVRAGDVAIELSFQARQTAAPPTEEIPAEDVESAVQHVVAPTVGVFYHASSPGAEPFVREGDQVLAGQQVGIVEAMKLMIPVEADRPGTVLGILKQNGADVEYGEPLLALAPL